MIVYYSVPEDLVIKRTVIRNNSLLITASAHSDRGGERGAGNGQGFCHTRQSRLFAGKWKGLSSINKRRFHRRGDRNRVGSQADTVVPPALARPRQEGWSRLPQDGSALPRTRTARDRDLGGKPRNKQTHPPHTHSPKHSAPPTPHGGPQRPAATRGRTLRSAPGCVRRRSGNGPGGRGPRPVTAGAAPAGGGAGAGRVPPQPGTAVTRGPTPGAEPAGVSAASQPSAPAGRGSAGDDGGAAHSIRRRQPRRKRRGVPAPGSAAPGRAATTRTLPVPTHRHHLRSLPRAGPAEPCRASPAAAAAAASHRGGRRARPGGCDRCLPRASLRTAGGRKRRRRRRRLGSQPPSSSSGARSPLPPPSPGASCSAPLRPRRPTTG